MVGLSQNFEMVAYTMKGIVPLEHDSLSPFQFRFDEGVEYR